MNSKKILVCDDDRGILEMLEVMLEEEGYEVVIEPNSINALNTIKTEIPDLILLDIWMPMISGDQILRSLRNDTSISRIPVLMYSASTDGRSIAESSGADSFISKPFDLDKLLLKIDSLIRKTSH